MATRNMSVVERLVGAARGDVRVGSWYRILLFAMLAVTFIVGVLGAVWVAVSSLGASSNDQNPPAAVAVEPTSTEVAPTATPTQEPAATTEIVEYPALDADWFRNEVWPILVEAGKIAGCEVSYKVEDYPEAFLIPLSVDTGSVLHQAVTELDLCGEGTSPPYLVLYVIGVGFPVEWLDFNLNLAGPTSALSLWEGTAGTPLPHHLVDGLTAEGSDELGNVFQCMVPWAKDLGLKPVWAVPVSAEFAAALNAGVSGRILGSIDSGTVPYQDCQ